MHFIIQMKFCNFSHQICGTEHADEGCECWHSGSAETSCNDSGMCKSINSASFLLSFFADEAEFSFTPWEDSDLTSCLGFWCFNSEKSPWTYLCSGEWNQCEALNKRASRLPWSQWSRFQGGPYYQNLLNSFKVSLGRSQKHSFFQCT